MNTQFNNTFYLAMSYIAQSKVAVYCGAKLFGFDSNNVTINLYMVLLKIAI